MVPSYRPPNRGATSALLWPEGEATIILAKMETTLQLLMRDGALRVSFKPKLIAEQYSAILECANRATTKAELTNEIENLSKQWGLPADVDSVLDPKN